MPGGSDRWRGNWRLVCPPGAVALELGRWPFGGRARRRLVRELRPGAAVVVRASAPGALLRCRAFARAAGLQVEREYLAFPSAAAPGYLVEDSPAAVRYFVERILVAPPGSVVSGALERIVALLRRIRPWRPVRALAPGRVLVGRRV